ncbi:MAG: beta-lactamase family protein [Lachnoclostridium sp.]|jgi:CubicO group peptidase (beta-lactamase class C family)|nr:beta-lactamase family protein [Lachnoclostridium sp.]
MVKKGKVDCTPQEVDYDESRVDALNKHFQALIDEKSIHCATYCVSRYGKIFMHGAVGNKTYKKEENIPATPDCIHYIASITKLFTTVAIMQLIEDGIICLNTPVGQILPQLDTPPFKYITFFHLLTHTSGMHADHGCYENKYQTSYWRNIDIAYQNHKPEDGEFDWISAAFTTTGSGLMVPPDTEWNYCSFGFVLLGAVIEKISGMSYKQYFSEKILDPLQMKDTVHDLTPDMAKRFILSSEHMEERINDVLNGNTKEDPLWDKIPGTASGLNSTSYDLNRFGNMMLAGGRLDGARILGRKTVEKITTLAIHDKPDSCWGARTKDRGYGIGFDMRNDFLFTYTPGVTYMHEGSGISAVYVDPKEEMVAAWIAPYVSLGGFIQEASFNVQNVIWSGII